MRNATIQTHDPAGEQMSAMTRPRDRMPGTTAHLTFRGVSTASSILTDLLAWIVGTELAALARHDFDGNQVPWAAVSILALLLAGGQMLVGAVVVLYQGRYVAGSFDEMRAVAVSATTVSAIATLTLLIVSPSGIARSLAFIAWPMALALMGGVRFVKRLIRAASLRPANAEPLLIVGAGWVGATLALRMLQDPHSPFVPVGFLDDDPGKSNLRLHGVPVLGGLADIMRAVDDCGASRVVVAINNADAELIRSVYDAAEDADVGCLVLPRLSESLGRSQLQLSALRDVDVADMIGRRPVDTDVESIADYISGRRVLVTGAGGSIGSELCRQLAKFGPAELVLLDRDESALHAVELSLYGQALLDSSQTVLADIRDLDALEQSFLEHQPEVVFHAAALKHLTLLERYPLDALRTNVYGTLNVLDAAARHGTTHFVNVSTDKAANPVSALGHSKRLAERLTAWYAQQHPQQRFLSVRFGNVLGSRGSVLYAFAAQIESGGPVTVTDPEVTRYFMTIPEACQLVIQAGAIGAGGDALVLDMGEPVKIVDVAKRMIALTGKRCEIVFTGLREGEKLHEELIGAGEHDRHTAHPLISHVDVPPLDPERLSAEPWPRRAAWLAEGLHPASMLASRDG